MKKIVPMLIVAVAIIGCDAANWKPDYIAFANVQKIRLTGLDGKDGIEYNVGYWETNNYNTKQMFAKYTKDGAYCFSPGIDIAYIAFERYYNPPRYRDRRTFVNNVLEINITYFDDKNTDE